jgi:hypothetical protein
MTARVVLILLIILLALTTMAASCTPDPDPTGGSDQTSWDQAIEATETYGAEEFHLQLTALATEEP